MGERRRWSLNICAGCGIQSILEMNHPHLDRSLLARNRRAGLQRPIRPVQPAPEAKSAPTFSCEGFASPNGDAARTSEFCSDLPCFHACECLPRSIRVHIVKMNRLLSDRTNERVAVRPPLTIITLATRSGHP
jgi:hypothetical protein